VARYGVTAEGFVSRRFDDILRESMERAEEILGPGLDLQATSPVRKLLEVAASEDARLWRRLEDLYYTRFLSSAVGDGLDLLGEDVGLERRFLFARGTARFALSGPQPGRAYTLPEGTVVVTTATPERAFYTLEPATLTAAAPQADVPVQAFDRGPESELQSGDAVTIDATFSDLYLNLGAGTTIAASIPARFAGGTERESDEVYRARLVGHPRTIWTLESIRTAALAVDGVTDVLASDPLGGVDATQSYFNLFRFNQRLFSRERSLGEPYFFDVVVAHEFARPWRTRGPVEGVFEQVTRALDPVRPVGIHPNVIEANHIEVGLRARVIFQPGFDPEGLLGAFKERLKSEVGALKLGGDVLYSQVMCALAEQPGVIDVQDMRLRRCPPAFGRITFGGPARFATEVVEVPAGGNLAMEPTEIAIFRLDSELVDFRLEPQ
jgi:uncharacterized phage protein gp47/JayE